MQSKIYDLIVVGGGPSGLFCARKASEKGKKVLLLEKKNSCGKKLLITGLSQCNLTQAGDIGDFFCHYGDNGKFLRSSLRNFTNLDLIYFFNDKGLGTVLEKENKVFPETKKAADVLSVLLSECKKNGAVVRCGDAVSGISKKNGLFSVETEKNRSYACENLVIATGGLTYPKTGSTGDGYVFAKYFGHKIVETAPALCSVRIAGYRLGDLAGISFKSARISLYSKNKKTRESFGDILLTHSGLSGPGILHMSRYIKPGDTLKISFVPAGRDEFRKDFSELLAGNGKKTVKSALMVYDVPQRFLKKVLFIAGVPDDLRCASLPKDKRNKIINLLCEHSFEVCALAGLNEAMVTKGGVSLDEVNSETMESVLCPGLYFVGEALDIDGDTGGYNLQAAFSTAYAAAHDIADKHRDAVKKPL